MQLHIDQGERPATAVMVGRFSADLDTEHPLAGKDLFFDIEIIGVREANQKPISDRHVRGPGGHHNQAPETMAYNPCFLRNESKSTSGPN